MIYLSEDLPIVASNIIRLLWKIAFDNSMRIHNDHNRAIIDATREAQKQSYNHYGHLPWYREAIEQIGVR